MERKRLVEQGYDRIAEHYLASKDALDPETRTLLDALLCGLTPIHELTYGLPSRATAYGDKGDNAAADEATILADAGVRLVPTHKATMAPNLWADKLALRVYRKRIETL